MIRNEQKIISYNDLLKEVSKFANVLKELGVKKGDRITIYMPMIPEAAYAMLACTLIKVGRDSFSCFWWLFSRSSCG